MSDFFNDVVITERHRKLAERCATSYMQKVHPGCELEPMGDCYEGALAAMVALMEQAFAGFNIVEWATSGNDHPHADLALGEAIRKRLEAASNGDPFMVLGGNDGD